jgi:hypothetical protein
MKEALIIFLGFIFILAITIMINRHEIKKSQTDYQAYTTTKKNLLKEFDKP